MKRILLATGIGAALGLLVAPAILVIQWELGDGGSSF